MTRPPHMNKSTGGKPPMDARRMAGYGSGIHGVTRKPSTTIVGGAEKPPATMQQGMLNEDSLNIGNVPSTPNVSTSFGSYQTLPNNDSPTVNRMPSASPMVVAPMGQTNKPSMKNRLKNGFRKSKPLLIFATVAGTTYFVGRALSGRRSARRDDPEDEDILPGGEYA